ncbi:hypothetical protein [Microbacterium sp. 13-71-7]|uniref:hypothetical protein n=1 Tax=Microbacterium sp. 13-71-7 TaxID=1970399 RepID=UPI000BDBDBF4|nr:hypothetical protein [Microbacterium sp. 13-71-7]OZB84993.1 MAG: hypothetical protein B7X32_05275 [Microbacterium sp. 13-71-7]
MYLADDITLTEQLTPYLPLIITVIGGLIAGGFAIWNRRRGNVETKTPTVAEIWAREERLGARVLWLEFWIKRLLAAFNGYVNRVRSGGSTDPTPTEQTALDLDISKETS